MTQAFRPAGRDLQAARPASRAFAASRTRALVALAVALQLARPPVAGGQRVAARDAVRDADAAPSISLSSSEVPPVARQVYEGTMSPFCPELLLANCPSPQADSLRRAVASRAAAGETRAHIEADLLATYGDVVRAAPPRRGFGLVAWVAPGLLLAAAAGWVTRWGRRSAEASAPNAPTAAPGPGRDGPARDGSSEDGTIAELAALDALLRRG